MKKKPLRERKVTVMELMLTGLARPDLVFCSMQSAAEFLEVSESYVFRLVNEGKLQRVRVVDFKDREVAVGVTQDSLDAYRVFQRSARKPQLELLPKSR